MSSEYPVGWDPYAWHDHHKVGKPRWRVKAGMFEVRDALCVEFSQINDRMMNECSFFLTDEWHRLKQAILACEEVEVALTTSNAHELPCGCVRDPLEHSGDCQRIHLMIRRPLFKDCSILTNKPLCGMDAYKVNNHENVYELDGKIFIANNYVDYDKVCNACLEVATR